MTYQDYIALTPDEIYSMKNEELRKGLLIMTKEANTRLVKIAKNKNLQKYIDSERVAQRITENGYIPFRRPRERKSQMVERFERLQSYLCLQSSSVAGLRHIRQSRNQVMIGMIAEYGDINYNDVQGPKPRLEKLGRLLQRLRDAHYISESRGMSQFVLGSFDILKLAFNIAFENPYKSLDSLFSQIEEKVEEITEMYTSNRRNRRAILGAMPGEP